MTWIAPLLWVVAFTAAPNRPSAETVGVLAVGPAPGPSAELQDINEKLRAELSRRLEGVLSPGELRARMQGTSSAASFSELERAFDGAIDELRKDPGRAIDWMQAILTDIERQPDSPEVFDLWKRVMLRMARARLEYASTPDPAAGQALARQAMERLLMADPSLSVDPLQHSKRLERLAQETRAGLKKRPTRKLTVKSLKSDTQIFVEGRPAGKAPVTISVVAGQYRVSGSRGGIHAPAEKIDLTEQDQVVTLDFSLVDTFRPTQGPGLAVNTADELKMVTRASAWLGLDRAVTTSLHADRDVTFLVAKALNVKPHASVTRQGWVRLTENSVPMGGYSDLASFLVTGTASDIVWGGPKPPPEARAPSGPRTTSKTLGWASLISTGVAVVAGGVAIWQATEASSYSDKASALIQGGSVTTNGNAEYTRALASYDDAKRIAVISGVTGGVLLATGVTLGIVSKNQTGRFWPILF